LQNRLRSQSPENGGFVGLFGDFVILQIRGKVAEVLHPNMCFRDFAALL
jgi:hypothetical protein